MLAFPKKRFMRFLVSPARKCSSRMCILSLASDVSVRLPSRFLSFVRVLLKMLKSRSHEAEFGQMDKMWYVSLKSGGGVVLARGVIPLYTIIGSGEFPLWRVWSLMASTYCSMSVQIPFPPK